MMVRSMLRAGAWPAVTGVSGAAVVVGGCGVAFPATATALFPIAFTLLAGRPRWPLLIVAFLLRAAFYVVVYRQAAWTRAAVVGNAVAALLWAVPTIWLLATDRFFNPAFHGLAHSDVKHWVTVSVIMMVTLITWDTVNVIRRRAWAARRGVPARPLGDLYTLV